MAAPLRFRRRYDPLLVVVDGVLAATVGLTAYALVVDGPLDATDVQRYRAASVGLTASWVLLARSTGLYRRPALEPGTSNLRQAAAAAALVGAALVAADLLVLDGALSGRWLGAVAAGLLVCGVASRLLLRRTRLVRRLLGSGPGPS